jgi:hypothetical protein
VKSATIMSSTNALALLKNCHAKKNVTLQLQSIGTVTQVILLCQFLSSWYSTYADINDIAVADELCYPASPNGNLSVNITTTTPVPYKLVPDIFATMIPTNAPTATKSTPSGSPTSAPPTSALPTTTSASLYITNMTLTTSSIQHYDMNVIAGHIVSCSIDGPNGNADLYLAGNAWSSPTPFTSKESCSNVAASGPTKVHAAVQAWSGF